MQLDSLVQGVKELVPNKNDNQILQALRKSARNFMESLKRQEKFTIELEKDKLEYRLELPVDTYISNANQNNDGIQTIIFDSVDYNQTCDILVTIGYRMNANDFPEDILIRYDIGIIKGACSILQPQLARYHDKVYYEHLAKAKNIKGVTG